MFAAVFCLSVLLPAVRAAAQEAVFTVKFTKDLLYRIATDTQDENVREITSRIMGLSPGATGVRIRRSGNHVTIVFSVTVERDLEMEFNFTLDKMAYYRMAAARTDVDGMLAILKGAVRMEPLIREVAYRFNERYAIVDLTLDTRPALEAREEAVRAAAARFVPPAEPAPPPPKKAAPVRKETPVPKKPAPKKKPPPPAPPKPPPPPREPDHLSAAKLRGAAPVVDGAGGDDAWSGARPFTVAVKGDSGKVAVTLSALWSSEGIYFLARWPDAGMNARHRPWVWSPGEKEYRAGTDEEDALALQFSGKKGVDACMLSGKGGSADLWFWKAGRTNPAGYAEDSTLIVSTERMPQSNSYQTRNHRTVWLKVLRDPGTPAYYSQVAGKYDGDVVPRYVSRPPDGSVADVAARGVWTEGHWTVEFFRPLDTGDPDDVTFSPGEDYTLSVAVFDARTRDGHSTSGAVPLRLER